MKEKSVLKGVICLFSGTCILLFVLTILWVSAATNSNVATSSIATSNTATVASEGIASASVASEGIATTNITSAPVSYENDWSTDYVSTEKNSNASENKSLEYFIENNIELTREDYINSYEYINGKLDYLDEDSASFSKTKIEDIVLEYVSTAESEAVARISDQGYYSVSVALTTESNLMTTNNYSQTNLNKVYNKKYGTSYDETCTETAGVSTIEYYKRKGYGGTEGDKNTIFNRLLNDAISIGAYPVDDNGGTYNSKFKKVVSKFYDYYKVDLDGNYDTLLLKSKIEKSISNYRPVVGHFSAPNGEGHSMCINGYYDIKVKYKKTSSSTSYSYTTYRYYRVNNGWKDALAGNDNDTDARLQYIWEGYLTSITRIE